MTEPSARILFSTGALYVYPLRVAFEVARAAGCDGVELVAGPETMWRRPGQIARLAAANGLAIRAVHPPLFGFLRWGGVGNLVCHMVDLALGLEARTIVLHPPFSMEAGDRPVQEFIAHLASAQHRLQGTGTQIALENPGFFRPWDHLRPLWHIANLHRLAEQCGLPMTLDTAHAGSSPYPLLESYAIVRDRLAHVHLSDLAAPPPWLDRPWLYSFFKHHHLPGAGTLPLAQFLHALAQDGFDGDITLELSPVMLRIWNLSAARRLLAQAVQDTRRMLQASDLDRPAPIE